MRTLKGHGGDVNEIKVHPTAPYLALTASKDESARLWNVTTGACVAMFCGDGAHHAHSSHRQCVHAHSPLAAHTSQSFFAGGMWTRGMSVRGYRGCSRPPMARVCT